MALIRKELNEHFWVLGPATALAVGVMALLVTEPLFVRGEPPFNAFRDFVLFALTPLCWLSVRQIVSREYTRSTWGSP